MSSEKWAPATRAESTSCNVAPHRVQNRMSIASRSISLERLIELAPPAPEQWVAIADVLLRALDREGVAAAHFRLDARDVRVTAAGDVEIASQQRLPTDSADEAGVQAIGHLAFEGLRGPDGTAASADPIVMVTLQALALGALGRTAPAAVNSLRARLTTLTSESTLATRREELAAVVQQIHRGALPVKRREPVAALPGRLQHSTALAGAFAAGIAAAAVLLILGSTAFLGAQPVTTRPHAAPRQLAPQEPTVEATPIPPPPTPSLTPPGPAPASAGLIRSVSLSVASSCVPSARCSGTVKLLFAGGRGPTGLAWSVLFYDRCEIPPKTLANGRFSAPAGWNTVISDSSFVLPPTSHRGWLVVVTSTPAEAASAPIEVAGPSC